MKNKNLKVLSFALLIFAVYSFLMVDVVDSKQFNVSRVRSHSYEAFTRVVVDLTSPLPYKIRKSKDKIIVKFLRGSADLRNCSIDINDDVVDRVEAKRRWNRSEIWFYLKDDNPAYEVFSLREPYRFVIDLRRSGRKVARGTVFTRRKEDVQYKIKRIIVDPGHGGKDPGAVGLRGLKEKDVVLDIAKRVKKHLDKDGNVEVLLTRSTDKFVSLGGRVRYANSKKGDLFISIHANAARNRTARGFETFYLSGNMDDEARAVSALENKALRFEGETVLAGFVRDVEAILWDLHYTEYRTESIELAKIVQVNLDRQLTIPNRGVKGALFYVLKGTAMPSILVETAFISNSRDEALLRSAKYREKMAKAISDSVRVYKKRYDSANGFTN